VRRGLRTCSCGGRSRISAREKGAGTKSGEGGGARTFADAADSALCHRRLLQRLLNVVFHPHLRRRGRGLAGDEAAGRAGKKAPLILCPCHKSPIDYMILSLICYDYGMQPPTSPPRQPPTSGRWAGLLRGAGAFFIRRKLQKAIDLLGRTMGAYVTPLAGRLSTQEFLIEGRRLAVPATAPAQVPACSLSGRRLVHRGEADAIRPHTCPTRRIVRGRSFSASSLGGDKQKERTRRPALAPPRCCAAPLRRQDHHPAESLSGRLSFRGAGHRSPGLPTPGGEEQAVQHLAGRNRSRKSMPRRRWAPPPGPPRRCSAHDRPRR